MAVHAPAEANEEDDKTSWETCPLCVKKGNGKRESMHTSGGKLEYLLLLTYVLGSIGFSHEFLALELVCETLYETELFKAWQIQFFTAILTVKMM